jgi:hypothetical protein
VTTSHPGAHKGVSRNTERKGVSKTRKEHSRSGEHRDTNKLRNGKEVNERGALTLWRVQSERQVRTRKGSR